MLSSKKNIYYNKKNTFMQLNIEIPIKHILKLVRYIAVMVTEKTRAEILCPLTEKQICI